MSSELMRKTAAVLDVLADTLDADEQQRAQQQYAERRQLAQNISEKYAEVTGEDLSLDAIEKIASSDQDLVSVFTKLAARAPSTEAPEGMGASSDINDDHKPVSSHTKFQNNREKLAAVEDADQRFLDWVNS